MLDFQIFKHLDAVLLGQIRIFGYSDGQILVTSNKDLSYSDGQILVTGNKDLSK